MHASAHGSNVKCRAAEKQQTACERYVRNAGTKRWFLRLALGTLWAGSVPLPAPAQARQADFPSQEASLLPRRSQTLETRSRGTVIKTSNPGVQYQIEGGAFVSRTENGGATWFGGDVSWNADLVAGAAPGPDVCWVGGRGGDIYLTTDGSQWRKIPPPAELDFVGVSATNARTAVVIAADGRRFRTKNGGHSWHEMK